MALSTGIIGKGTKVGYSDTTTYTYVANLVDVNQPELSAPTVDATHYESPDNNTEKKAGGWREWSDVSGSFHYHKTQQVALDAIVGIEKNWQFLLTDGSAWVGKGILSKLGGGSIPNKDVIKSSFTITPTGKFTFTAGA